MNVRNSDWRSPVASWLLYWGVLAVVSFGPAARRWFELQRPDRHGSVSWSFEGTGVEVALWLVGPPLLLALT